MWYELFEVDFGMLLMENYNNWNYELSFEYTWEIILIQTTLKNDCYQWTECFVSHAAHGRYTNWNYELSFEYTWEISTIQTTKEYVLLMNGMN